MMLSLFRLPGLVTCFVLLAAWPVRADGADEILKEIKSNWTLPAVDRSKSDDPNYVRGHEDRLRAALNRRVDLIGKLYRAAPAHPLARELMMKRWAAMMNPVLTDRRAELSSEVTAIAGDSKNPLRVDAAYFKAYLKIGSAREEGPDGVMKATEDFIALAPRDERGAQLLARVADLSSTPAEQRSAIRDRIIATYPNTIAARRLKESLRRVEGIGKPFQLSFRDAITGKAVSLRDDWKGKVVVVDFWATWCVPCVAETPKLKALYAQYKERGVEFVGVSLDAADDSGLKALSKFVKENQVGWPQFQGQEARDFATSWGATRIPAVFVVDSRGNLHTTDGHGHLETLLPQLLK